MAHPVHVSPLSIDSLSTAPAAQRLAARPVRVLALLALWLLITLGLRPLMLPDEGRYANVAREMLHGGPWVPLLNGLPFFHKPPLMYWIDIAAMSVFGINAFSARMAPFVGAMLLGGSMYLGLRRWRGEREALAALVVLATCPFFFFGAQYANHDMLVAGCITATVFAMLRAVEAPRVALRWVLAAWALAGFGVLSKGLIGVVLPALVVVPWLLARGRWRQVLALAHPAGIGVFLAVALPWMVAMQHRFPGFFQYFIVDQHFNRFQQSNFNNVQPAWFYLAVLPLLTLPWSLWALPALRRASGWRAAFAAQRPGFDAALVAWWMVAVIGFFSLPSSKLVGYELPTLAPWCIVLGALLGAWPRAWRRTALVAVLLCAAVAVGLAWKTPKSTRPAARLLATQIAPRDRVVYVGDVFHDFSFYADLAVPPIVVTDWGDPTIPQRDNWRKELFDAAAFDPAAGRALLQPTGRLAALTCHTGTVWFVVKPHNAALLEAVAPVTKVFEDGNTVLARRPGRLCAP